MLSVEDWAEIRRLHVAEGMAIKQIVERLGVSRNTVRAAVRDNAPPRYERPAVASRVDGVEARIRELLRDCPTIPATVIAERIGWPYGLTVLKERVREIRPFYLPADPSSRTAYLPGEIGQWDFWFPDIVLPVGWGQQRAAKQLPVLTLTTGYARWLGAVLVPSRAAEDLFAGMWQLLELLGAVPKLLVWDGEGAVGRRRGPRIELTEACQAFRGVLATRVHICKPADPEAKGLVERNNGYLETSFLPGRSFTGPADFNGQLAGWLPLANGKTKRVLGCAPTDRIGADLAAMIMLPPVPPTTGWHYTTRLARDHYVRLDANDYSVHPSVVGRRVEVSADLDRVRVVCEGRAVADHGRCWAKHQTLSDPVHVEAAKAMRRDRITLLRPATDPEVQVRALRDYDTALGLDDGVA